MFEGFSTPTKNYFHMPNEWINICAEITNLAELKVVQYVLRHTWGYHEYDGKPKPITVDEFMNGRKRADGSRIDKGTGLKSDRSVKDGIKAAIEHEYLICEVDDTDKARIKKAYALKMLSAETRQVETTPLIRQVETTRQTGRNYPSEVQNLPLDQADTTPRSEKDTLEKHSRKKECTSKVTADKPETPSSTHSSLSSVSSTQETPSPQEEKPSSEISRAKGYWKQLGYRDEKSAAWAELGTETKTFEEFKSLFDFTAEQLRKDTKITNKEVHPGNMLNYLNAWKQDKKRREQPPESKPQASKPYGRDLAAEHRRMVAEMQAKMAVSSKK